MKILKLSLISFLFCSKSFSTEVIIDPYKDLNYDQTTVYDYSYHCDPCIEVHEAMSDSEYYGEDIPQERNEVIIIQEVPVWHPPFMNQYW